MTSQCRSNAGAAAGAAAAVAAHLNPELMNYQHEIEKFQKKHQFEFQILPDPEMTVTQLYGVRNIPITYLVNTSGIVVGRALGPREWTRPKLLEFFENLASEQPNP